MRADLDKAYSLLPCKQWLSLHASYGEFKRKKVDRNEIGSEHFNGWMNWAEERGVKLDFNGTFFSHW
jgi:L-rhamnose isomerase